MTEHRNDHEHDGEEPIFRDKRRIDPETGEVRAEAADAGAADAPGSDSADADVDGATVSDEELEQLIADARAADGDVDEPVERSEDAIRADATLEDLQRVTAEYANYRRRTEQEKIAAHEASTAEVLRSLLPVLDDFDRAEEHGDLPEDGALTVIVTKLRGSLDKLGLAAYGEKGESFDPQVHEAIAQLPNPEVTGETVADVIQRGYRVGERVVRVAKVAVFVPAS